MQWTVYVLKISRSFRTSQISTNRWFWGIKYFSMSSSYPNLKSVRELIYKRGFVKIDKQRIPITDNSLIERSLGKFGIICVEDLIHEIFTIGPHFKEANNFLWPFKLSNPTGGLRKKRNHFVEGGDFGNREEKINALIRKMNWNPNYELQIKCSYFRTFAFGYIEYHVEHVQVHWNMSYFGIIKLDEVVPEKYVCFLSAVQFCFQARWYSVELKHFS